jgi:hypothetical protein
MDPKRVLIKITFLIKKTRSQKISLLEPEGKHSMSKPPKPRVYVFQTLGLWGQSINIIPGEDPLPSH